MLMLLLLLLLLTTRRMIKSVKDATKASNDDDQKQLIAQYKIIICHQSQRAGAPATVTPTTCCHGYGCLATTKHNAQQHGDRSSEDLSLATDSLDISSHSFTLSHVTLSSSYQRQGLGWTRELNFQASKNSPEIRMTHPALHT